MIFFMSLFVLEFCSVAHAESEWFYSDLSRPKAPQITLTPTHIGGHFKVAATTCPSDDLYICILGDGFQFAVPKDVENSKTWVKNGVQYKVMSEADIQILGRPIRAYWIGQNAQKNSLRFLYSKVRGLISFTSAKQNGPLFLVESKCGFGASEECAAR